MTGKSPFFPTQLFIGGRWVDGTSRLAAHDKFNGAPLAKLRAAGPAEARQWHATHRLPDPRWASIIPWMVLCALLGTPACGTDAAGPDAAKKTTTAGGAGAGGAAVAGSIDAGSSGDSGSSAGPGGDGGQGQGGAELGGTGGSGGSAGETIDSGVAANDKEAAKVLDGYVLEKPCVDTFKPTPNPMGDCCCEEKAENENQHHTLQFGGDAAVTYNVTLHVRGVTERYWYEGGALDPVGKLFYSGGLPTIHNAATATKNANLKPGQGACKIHPPQTDAMFALPFTVPPEINPSDGCFNGFNVFALVVSSPKKSYYLNYTTDFDGIDRQPHQVYKDDYAVTIPIQGQASLDFYTIDGDHHQVTNDGTMMFSGLKVTEPYNGNFLQLDVVSVKRAN